MSRGGCSFDFLRSPSPRPPKGEEFRLEICTCNCTAWSSAQDWLLVTSAHVVLLQEHHLVGDEKIAHAQRWLLRHGWKGLFVGAKATTEGGSFAGVAVLT